MLNIKRRITRFLNRNAENRKDERRAKSILDALATHLKTTELADYPESRQLMAILADPLPSLSTERFSRVFKLAYNDVRESESAFQRTLQSAISAAKDGRPFEMPTIREPKRTAGQKHTL